MEQQQATAPRSDRTSPVGVIDVEQAEAALVEHYPRLVRLAYLVLPPKLGRNRRVLTAHSVVQRALPRNRTSAERLGLPAQRGRRGAAALDPGHQLIRLRVLRAALAAEHPRLRLPVVRREVPLPPLLPQVWGLRLFPRSGGADELALDQALSALSGPGRAAYVLRGLEAMSDPEVYAALAAAGVEDPAGALAEADRAGSPAGSKDQSLLESAEFDPCTLQARPTDLMRRRQHVRAMVAAGAAVLVCGALLGLPGDGWGPDGAAAPPYARNAAAQAALDPARLTHADADAWRTGAREDFSAWPARGDRLGDRGLLRRALAVWARPGARVRVSATPETATGPAAGPPRLLYAGVVGRAAVVMLYDGLRVVRYAESADGSAEGAALDFARTDAAGPAGSAALVIDRGDGNVRYLTAPWVKKAEQIDLLTPQAPGQALRIGEDGVSDPLRSPAQARDCTGWPALRMDGQVLTDLGELTPARLTYGDPRHPRALGGQEARTAWARTACHLPAVRGRGVREVNSWEFARQQLPEGGGSAAWVCTRAETWRGTGSRTLAQFQGPAGGGRPQAPGAVAARAEGGTACGPRAPRALAGVLWKARGGQWWLLAAGSPDVAEITASGGVGARAEGRTLAVRAKAGARAELAAKLADGGRLSALH